MPVLESAQITTSPSTEAPPPSAKRKRDSSVDNSATTVNVNGDTPRADPVSNQTYPVNQAIKDICEVLKRYDTDPSILAQTLPPEIHGSASEAPVTKKPKLLDSEAPSSISQKVEGSSYTSITELVEDVEEASAKLYASLQPSEGEKDSSQWKYQPDSLAPTRTAVQIKVFKRLLKNFVMQIEQPNGTDVAVKEEGDRSTPLANGYGPQTGSTENDFGDTGGKAVLTLFGNAQGQHKQLFSSFQKPLPRHFWTDDRPPELTSHFDSDTLPPIRENGLPSNQIVGTKLVAVQSEDALPPSKRNPKFRDLFPSPSSLPPLTPPKPLPSSTTRSSSITWTNDLSSKEPSRRNDHTTEKLPTAQWLGYDGISSEQEPSSPEARRKRRDRALSSGEVSLEPLENTKAALARAKEDALFRRVYSSFAPSVDNSSALIPEETKNDIWWRNFGGRWYDHAVSLDPALEEEEDALETGQSLTPNLDDDFKDVVENWDFSDVGDAEPGVLQDEFRSPQVVLEKIAQLLEALQSHQRVRNAHLGSSARVPTATSPSQLPDSLLSKPSDEERTIYNELRLKLAGLVSRLPPYTLAKAAGDQLSDLVLSKAIILESKNYQGTMDEDQATRLSAAATSLSATLGASRNATATRSGSSSHTRNPSGQLPASTSVTASRTGQMNKPPLSNWQTPAQSYGSSLQRPIYNPPSTYGRTPLNQYVNGRPITANQVNGTSISPSQNQAHPAYQQRGSNATGQYGGYNATPSLPRNPSSLQSQSGYPMLLSRAPNNSYVTPTTGGMAPTAPMTVNPPSQANMVPSASNNSSRPQTPSTPAPAPTPQIRQDQQSPGIASQQANGESSNGPPTR